MWIIYIYWSDMLHWHPSSQSYDHFCACEIILKDIVKSPIAKSYKISTKRKQYVGQVTELWLSCYLVFYQLIAKPGNKAAAVSWPDLCIGFGM